MGCWVALNHANGIIAKASKSKIQITKLIYSTLILIRLAIGFCKKNATKQKTTEEIIKEIDAVPTTKFLFCSLLKKRKNAVSIPYANTTLNKTK